MIKNSKGRTIDVSRAIQNILADDGYHLIDTADIKETLELFSSLPDKFQEDILLSVFQLKKQGKEPEEIFATVAELIDGAIELLNMDESDSDIHKPPDASNEQVKIYSELAERKVDYDAHFKAMEKLILEGKKSDDYNH